MITYYYRNHKNIVLFIISTILTFIGWGVSILTFNLYKSFYLILPNDELIMESVPFSLVIRLIYGLSTVITNYYLDEEYKINYSLNDLLIKYQYYLIFSVLTIISGWFLSIYVFLNLGYFYSVFVRLLYGILCTFITLRFIPKKIC